MLSMLSKRLTALARIAETELVSEFDTNEVRIEPDQSRTDANRDTAQQTQSQGRNESASLSSRREERHLSKLVLETSSEGVRYTEGVTVRKDCEFQQHKNNSRVSRQRLQQNPDYTSQRGVPIVSQSTPRDEYISDLVMRSYVSARLINAFQNTKDDLRTVTVDSYMLSPDTALARFKQFKKFDEKTALELDNLVRNYAREIHQKKRDTSDNIVEVISQADCSVRLHNAIVANADWLPISTVQSYMRSPEYARQIFLKLPNLGRKSADELDKIIRNFVSNSVERSGDNDRVPDVGNLYQKAMQAAEVFFSDLYYPDELFEWSPPVRLANLLKVDQERYATRFFDFLRTYDEITARLLSLRNCGGKSIEQLNEIVSQLVKARLSACGADKGIEPNLRRLVRGEKLHQDELNEIIALEKLRPENIRTTEVVSVENLSLFELISASISTLEERQQDILRRRYGIEKERTETLEEVAASYNVTRERIRQIEKKAKQRIANKRMVKTLVAALKREDTLGTLFKDRKIVSEEQLGIVSKNLKVEERFAINLAYGDMRSFLNAETVHTKAGWVREQYLHLVGHKPENLLESLRQRIVSVIRDLSLPIRLSRVASLMPDYPVSVIKDELSKKLDASFKGDIVSAAPRLPSSVRCILILREAGHAMHCEEIRARMHEVFGKDESIGHIGSTLARLEEALIVKRGTYNLYENLGLTHSELIEIRDRAFYYMETIGGFVNTKVLFSQLFQGETERFGAAFGHYMLLGILQDDKRFETKPGLMIGLASENGESEFRGLGEDILAILSEAKHAMTLMEIANELKGRRDVQVTSISIGLENSSEAVSVGQGRFDLTTRVIGNSERQNDLIFASAISLADGERTVFALSDILRSVWGDISTTSLLSFLKSHQHFQTNQNIVVVVDLPKAVSEYIDIRNQVLKQEDTGLFDLEAIRKALRSNGASDLTQLDYMFVDKNEVDSNEKMLRKILGDFGIE
ncbi:MAG: hypothetical protein OXC68_10890 [Aestuariivita sp.]|nr:hypothetical protein [Aestuariivita sp.]